jgi:hypothetical protein
MNKVIWKYELETEGLLKVEMPIGAEILALQTQYEKPCLWVLVDLNVNKSTRHFEIYGTGQPVWCDPTIERKYIGTYQLQGGLFVGHLFEHKV